MKNMTTNGKLLAQDDIDALLGEAGIEGNYESEITAKDTNKGLDKKSKIKFSKRTKGEIQTIMN